MQKILDRRSPTDMVPNKQVNNFTLLSQGQSHEIDQVDIIIMWRHTPDYEPRMVFKILTCAYH